MRLAASLIFRKMRVPLPVRVSVMPTGPNKWALVILTCHRHRVASVRFDLPEQGSAALADVRFDAHYGLKSACRRTLLYPRVILVAFARDGAIEKREHCRQETPRNDTKG